jgi:hypothetical protein
LRGLRLVAFTLKVDFVFDILSPEDVMASANTFLEVRLEQQPTEIIVSDIGIRRASQHLPEKLLISAHA